MRARTAMCADAAHALIVGHDNLTRLHIAHKFRADAVQRAGLRSKDDLSARHAPHAQGAEPDGVPHSDELARRHDDQAIRPQKLWHSALHRLLDRIGVQAFARNEVRDDLRVIRRMKDCTGKLQLPPQFCRICQVAIVRHRHLSVDMAHDQRLRIFPADRPRRGIPCMSHGDLPAPERRQVFFGEHIPHQAEVLVHADHAVPVDGDPAALLPPVLQGK